MAVIDLTEDNLEQYVDFIGQEELENIGREYYRGIVLTDDDGKPLSAGIWELMHLDNDEKDTEARLTCMLAENDDEAGRLLEACSLRLVSEEVKRSFFELDRGKPNLSRKAYEQAEYTISEEESGEIVVTLKELAEQAFAKKSKIPPYIKELGSLMVRPFRRGVMDCVFHSRRELMEDLGTIPMSWFEQQISSYVETDGRVSGLLLIHKTPSGKLKLEVFTATGADSKKDLLYMMIFSLKQAERYYDGDTEIVIRRRDEDVKKLTDYLLPEAKGRIILRGVREEA